MHQEQQPNKSFGEKIIGLSKTLDKVGIIGGVAVGFLINPVAGGLIAGGSIATYELGNRAEHALRSHKQKKLGKYATKASLT